LADNDKAWIALFQSAEGISFPAANGATLAALIQKSRSELGLEPPDEYMSLLHQTDGVVANGLMIYGTVARSIDDIEMPEVIAINQQRRSYDDAYKPFFQIGEIDDDIIAYHAAERVFGRIDRASGELCERAENLFSLIAPVLKSR
jgi:hypothetical protein